MATKKKLIGAKKGHELLKKKADALKKKFREVMIAIVDVRKIRLTSLGKEENGQHLQ